MFSKHRENSDKENRFTVYLEMFNYDLILQML